MHSLSFLATLAVVIGLISWGGTLNAQTAPSTPAQPTQDQQAPTSTQQPSPDTPPAQQPSAQPSTPSTPAPDAQQPPAPQAPAQASPSQSSPTSAAGAPTSDSQVFSGTVEKSGDKYVLKDDGGKTYDIDHQDDVKKFEGKRVRVQGTLDPSGTKILVK
jgi:outer membrane biosynthesis protein TonB